MRPLTPSDREALDSRWAKLITASQQADYGDAWWNKRNDELTDLAKRARWDEFRTAQKKAGDPELNDAGAHWSHFKDEVLRHGVTILAAHARLEMVAAADDPLRFDRADVEPQAVPVPPGVDGFAPSGRVQRPTKSPVGAR